MLKDDKGVAICFSGGGGKGAYEIGVWKALNEFGIVPCISAISGTSVGALNAALFAQGSYEIAYDVWSNISQDAVCTLNDKLIESGVKDCVKKIVTDRFLEGPTRQIYRFIKSKSEHEGFITRDGLITLIKKYISYKAVLAFKGPIYISAYDTSRKYTHYFELHRDAYDYDRMRDILLASASIPVVFGEVEIDGTVYWDGGAQLKGPFVLPNEEHNTPVGRLHMDGYRTIITIHCSREISVDKAKYPGSTILEIMPQEDMGGLIKGTLNFGPNTVVENMERGYADAVRILRHAYEMHKANENYCRGLFSLICENDKFAKEHDSIIRRNNRLNRELEHSLQNFLRG